MDTRRILIVSDLHLPYQRSDAIDFLKELKKEYKPTFVCSIGDLLDSHALSFHDSNPDLFSAGHELVRAKDYVKELESIFPELIEIDSNHGL